MKMSEKLGPYDVRTKLLCNIESLADLKRLSN
jgi:hypothetical protein